ncbi:hypothetical protein N9Y92_04190 [Chlamydiales bacterium]|nr:hypothetical protein [Chlamydiales bacterium]
MPATLGSGRLRCRLHGGFNYKRATHGKTTVRAVQQRKKERAFLREMKIVSAELENN